MDLVSITTYYGKKTLKTLRTVTLNTKEKKTLNDNASLDRIPSVRQSIGEYPTKEFPHFDATKQQR